jgi:hypothetical protein
MNARRLMLCSALLLALLVPRLAAHGYGTRPPWVAAGVVRVLAPDDDAYLEVRVQHSGHLGARGALSAPDLFRIVQLEESGSARTTPRWERELQRRTLAPGDEVVGNGVLARAPLALALYPGGTALAVADRLGITVQERSGDVRFHLPFYDLFWTIELEQATEEHTRNPVWPFGWLDAPPRTVAVWSDGTTLTAALRTSTGQWLVGCADATTGAVQLERPSTAVLAEALAAALARPTAPEASIALEALALGAPPSTPSIHTTIPSTPPAVALAAARQILANERATVEARLVAAQVVARSALAVASNRSELPRSEPTPSTPARTDDIELVAATALRVLQSGDGHPSMDDLLAAEVLVGLAPALVPERWAAPLAELALARGVPELFPALTAFGAAGVTALADTWLAVEAGRLSPYAEARATSFTLVHHLARALLAPSVASSAVPSAVPSALDGTASTDADTPLAAFARWLAAPRAPVRPRPASETTPTVARGALLAALLAVEPTLDDAGNAGPDVRALLVRGLSAEHPAALDVAGPATRALVGALVEALAAADRLARLPASERPSEPEADRRARATDLAARASASLQRIVDLPPPPF